MPGGFNPNAAYQQVGSDTGQVLYLQGTTLFDVNGNVVAAPPKSVPPGFQGLVVYLDKLESKRCGYLYHRLNNQLTLREIFRI